MPKHELDHDDPLELNGVGIVSSEDTTETMTECFVDEFIRLGYNHKQILALFRNPHYLGMNMALEKRGEPFVRDVIAEVFARRGKAVTWPDPGGSRREGAQIPPPSAVKECQNVLTSAATMEMKSGGADPMGAPAPELTI